MSKYLVTVALKKDDENTYFKNEIIESEKFPSRFSIIQSYSKNNFENFRGITGITPISDEDAIAWVEEK